MPLYLALRLRLRLRRPDMLLKGRQLIRQAEAAGRDAPGGVTVGHMQRRPERALARNASQARRGTDQLACSSRRKTKKEIFNLRCSSGTRARAV